MSEHPIHDALEALWDGLFEANRYDMVSVLLESPQQAEALHMEMRGDLGIDQRYHFDHDVGRFMWRHLPIRVVPDRLLPSSFRAAPVGDGSSVAISWKHTCEFIRGSRLPH